MEHTSECNQAQAKFKAEVEAYHQAWPNHCDHCHGWGSHSYTYDPSPAGVALGPGFMVDTDPCSDCIEEAKCPRCGQQTFPDDTTMICSSCGFDLEHTNKNPGLPEPPDCVCWMKE